MLLCFLPVYTPDVQRGGNPANYGVSNELVSKMLGLSNISTTKQYALIVDTLIIDEMKKVQQLYPICRLLSWRS